MQGHIQRRGKASWRVKFEKGRAEDGTRLIGYETVRGPKKAAQQRLAELLVSINNGSFVEPTPMTVGEHLSQWLTDYAEPKVSAKTCERYRDIIEGHLVPHLGAHKLTNLKPLTIQSYYTKALKDGRRNGKGGLAPRTVLHHHRVLFAALRQAVRWRLLAVNPAEAVEPPRPGHAAIEVLMDAELHTVLKMARETRVYTPILLAATTGMRRSEVLGLCWPDLDLVDKI